MLDPLIYDENTGLPALPESYAWSVEENSYSVDYDDELIVQIVKSSVEKLSWWDRLVGKAEVVHWSYHHKYREIYEKCPNTAEGVKTSATKAYNQLRDEELKSFERQKLVGFYPPKKL